MPSDIGRSNSCAEDHIPRVISFTSGKGGVGKTNVVANLAFVLSRKGKRVLVLDADLSLANIDILLGLAPRYTMRHV
ncbi:MAG: P-loop NTPase, partial [Deltaproteobacteria bacterium]|nr:P-loop NTPase [Deltaproteobacteria bacterium]